MYIGQVDLQSVEGDPIQQQQQEFHCILFVEKVLHLNKKRGNADSASENPFKRGSEY